MDTDFYTKLISPAQTKIVLLVMDGLGGLPETPDGKTELETAYTPNLDRLAACSKLGLSQPAGPGVTVGSGPGHLALFGYDPIRYEIGRGALEALGVDFELGPEDLAARGNFCTVDGTGCITDRRAGRLPTEMSRQLAEKLRAIRVPGAMFFVEPVKEHRFAFIARGPGLGDALTETDPLKTGVPVMPVQALKSESEQAACIVNQFIDQARCLLANELPANMITLRGFNKLPAVPSFANRYGLRAASIAVNGMYRGVSKLAGMELVPLCGETIADEFATLEKYWAEYDFFYMHFKKTDTCGESGDFMGKARVIGEIDAQIPRLMALNPDVVVVTGDHSSPAVMRSHSWHPVPTLLYSRWVLPDGIATFGERACARGSLGVFPATHIMPLALANAQRIAKFGA